MRRNALASIAASNASNPAPGPAVSGNGFSLFDPTKVPGNYYLADNGRSANPNGASTNECCIGTTSRGNGDGKRQVEFLVIDSTSGAVGIAGPSSDYATQCPGWADGTGVCYFMVNGAAYIGGAGQTATTISPALGQYIQMVVDFTAGAHTLQLYINGGSTSGICLTTALAVPYTFDGTYFPYAGACGSYSGAGAFLNTGSEAFRYPIAGATPWN